MRRSHSPLFSPHLLVLAAAGALPALSTFAEPTRVIMREGDAVGPAGHLVTAVSATATNGVGGFGVAVNTSDGATTLSHILATITAGLGTPAAPSIVVTESVIGTATQTAFEGEFGLSDAGQVAYSATVNIPAATGVDSAWLGTTPLTIQRDPAPPFPGLFWSFGSRVKMTHSGIPYWRGGIATTAAGSTSNRILLTGDPAMPYISGNDNLPNLPAPITPSAGLFTYRFSASGTHRISSETLQGVATTTDVVVVLDGQGLVLDGTLVRENNIVPPAIGGRNGENWINFAEYGINEAGNVYLFGDTDAATTADQFMYAAGQMRHRDGDTLDGVVLDGTIPGASVNETGDYAMVWGSANNATSLLFVNRRLVLREGDPVDLDRDGTPDTGSSVVSIDGTFGLALSSRIGGLLRHYQNVTVDVNATTSTADDIDALLEITICLPDVNRSGTLTVQDIFDFLNLYFANDLAADYNNSFSITVQDIFDFLSGYFAGCA